MPEQKDVGGFLTEQQRKSSGDLAKAWETLEDLYNKKLWHQLTLELLKFIKNPVFAEGDGLLQLYHNFVSDFEHRINPLSLVEIIFVTIKQMQDPKEAISFIEKIQEKVKTHDEATILCMTIHGNFLLLQREMDETKKIIESTEERLNSLDGVTAVHGRYYELCSNYHKLMGHHAAYYRDSLRFLGCTELDELTEMEQRERAFNLGLAALLGKGVYNFGELLAHPVLEKLKDTDKQWLIDLLYAFNSGNISRFDELKAQWGGQADLAANELDMRRKISLLCLMEMTFKRPSNNRQMTFQEIADETRLPVNEVELLVMRALSLDLVRGSIDQVEQRVHMTWVQPRVLDKQQIGTMQTRLAQWCVDVKSMEDLVEDRAHDILG